MTDQPTYYVKHIVPIDPAGPSWAVYRRTEAGSAAVCLCYDEPMARKIMALLIADEHSVEEF